MVDNKLWEYIYSFGDHSLNPFKVANVVVYLHLPHPVSPAGRKAEDAERRKHNFTLSSLKAKQFKGVVRSYEKLRTFLFFVSLCVCGWVIKVPLTKVSYLIRAEVIIFL